MSYSCGIDFGTSNSVVAIARSDSPSPEVIASEPSCILMTDDRAAQKLYVGAEAISHYRGAAGSTRFVKSMKTMLSDPGFTNTRIFGRAYTPPHLVRPIIAHLKNKAEERLGEQVRRVVMGRPASKR